MQTDLAIIGAGPGGYAAAFRAAELGMDVTLISEDPQPGGVCLLRGCIPSKALLTLSEVTERVRWARETGVSYGRPKFEPDKIRKWKSGIIDGLAQGLVSLCEKRGVRFVRGRARFVGPDSLRVEGEAAATLEFRHAIIATGSVPAPLPGVEVKGNGRIWDSTTALELDNVPETLLVVGAGYVGLELGQVYATLGSKVTLVELADRIMPGADADLAKPLARRVEEQFEQIVLETKVRALKLRKHDIEVDFDGKGRAERTRFDYILVSVGRRANLDGLELEQTGVELTRDGFISVDARRRTTDRRIFAIGDVTGGMQLAHEAMLEGKVAAEAIAGRETAFDPRAIPAVVYTDPQIVWCGLSEQEAERQNREVRITRFPWRASGRAHTIGATDGVTKLLFDAEDGRLLGMGAVGSGAEHLVAEAVHAIEMGAVAEDLALTLHPHPTLSETLGEAAELFRGGATHLRSEGKD